MSIKTTRRTTLGLFGSAGIPDEGLKSAGPLVLDWSTKGIPGNANALGIDLRAAQTTVNLLSQVLAMYVDNSAVASKVIFLFDSGMVVNFPASSQGFLPIAQGNPIRFVVTSAAAAGLTNVLLYNYEIPPLIWAA